MATLKSTSMKGVTIPDNQEQPEDKFHGDLVKLVWFIEKLRAEPRCCMNRLVRKVKENFTGLENIKQKS
jgi:hypothetical protein